jgi:hypothetical protein
MVNTQKNPNDANKMAKGNEMRPLEKVTPTLQTRREKKKVGKFHPHF